MARYTHLVNQQPHSSSSFFNNNNRIMISTTTSQMNKPPDEVVDLKNPQALELLLFGKVPNIEEASSDSESEVNIKKHRIEEEDNFLEKRLKKSGPRLIPNPSLQDCNNNNAHPSGITFGDLPDDVIDHIFYYLVPDIVDFLNFSEVNCQTWIVHFHSDPLWRAMINHHYSRLVDTMNIQESKDQKPTIPVSVMTMRGAFIALARSCVSVLGIPYYGKPAKTSRIQNLIQRREQENRNKIHGIAPFWILHYHWKRIEKVESWVSYKTEESVFGNAIRMTESQRIQIEGSVNVRVPGSYRVFWRIRLENVLNQPWELGPVTFVSRVR